jgi:hypothetical protein
MSPNWSVRLGLTPLLDRTTSLSWGNNSHWLAKILLEQEGEGGNYVLLEDSKKLNFLLGDEANKSTLSGNFHQRRLPTAVG